MAIVILAPTKNNTGYWKEGLEAEFRKAGLNVSVETDPDSNNPEDIKMAVVWKHKPEWLYRYPNLQVVSSMGAGVDHIIADEKLPQDWKIVRIVDPHLTQSMSNYLLAGVLNYHKKLWELKGKQEKKEWAHSNEPERPVVAGILGMGELGADIAKKLSALGFQVCGYSNSKKDIPGVKSFAGEQELAGFLQEINVLICLLPLNTHTKGFLNRELFEQCRRGTFLINVARGEHLAEEDLLWAIEHGRISGAMLDVFHQEPLPKDHPFWNHPDILITPHIASVTLADAAIPQIAENYQRILSGEKLINQIDRLKGY